jgi:ATP-dependent DNA helicase RecG
MSTRIGYDPEAPVQYLKGVGPSLARTLAARLGVRTVEDLLYHIPRRYEDRRHFATLHAAPHNEFRTFRVKGVRVSQHRLRSRKALTEVHVTDGTAVAVAKFWGSRHYHKTLAPGTEMVLWGRVRRWRGQIEIENPEVELLGHDEDTLHMARIVPVHPASEGVSARLIRRIVHAAVERYAADVPEPLPADVRSEHGLMPLADAVRTVHFPDSLSAPAEARRRLAFDELLGLQFTMLLRRRSIIASRKPHRYRTDGGLLEALTASLPFRLTTAQSRVIDEIRREMYSPHPVNRLLQGDVGSGKTVVAGAAVVLCVQGGHQAAVMAPTEILAEQHYLSLRPVLEPLGIQTVLLAGGLRRRERDARLGRIASGEADLVVGTHALLQEDVVFDRLALVVVDEQHKFGVTQRAALREKGHDPDVLVMTATPIPRTLALTLYGDLDVSVLDELPAGRRPVSTHHRFPSQRDRVYSFLRQEVAAGRQAYIVCPLVEESDKLAARAATEMHERLQREVLPELSLGLLHGRMTFQQKEGMMDAFRRGQIPILVATSVIEVGIDVPNATVMVVEDAERFGLAQLHQLRGRVGRGSERSYCILISALPTDEARRRIEAIVETNDGFRIAQVDLELRGPGEFFGTRQHGMPDLRVANPIQDAALLEQARQVAGAILDRDAALGMPQHRLLRDLLLRRYGESRSLLAVG